MLITKQAKDSVLKHIEKTWATKVGRKAQETANALLSTTRAQYQIETIERFTAVKGKKLLEIGSGYSVFLALARKKYKVNAYGIEPAKWGLYNNAFEISKQLLKINGIPKKYLVNGNGEDLHFPNNHFDIVYSHYLLEHVENEKKIICEAVRVLKKGGILIFVFPNYGSFWEGHYGIVWLPFLTKTMAKFYVRLWKKDPSIINDLNFVTKKKVQKIIMDLPQMRVASWGEEIFEEMIRSLIIPNEGTLTSAKKVIGIIHRLRLTTPSLFLAKVFKLHTPIVLVAIKQ